jgi:hypothetical protein
VKNAADDIAFIHQTRAEREANRPPFDLPDGFRLWSGRREGVDDRPRLVDGAAFDTWPGRLVRRLEPFTEAEAGGMLATVLTATGAAIGPGPYVYKGNVRHHPRLFSILVGGTSTGRKGTATATPSPILEAADPDFFATRTMGGFGSGEAVVDELADPDENGDGGSPDKRLLVKEPELTRLLKIANRQGSTVSELLREGWDGGRLQVRSRSKRSVATGGHVCLLGHVTPDGLRRHLADEDVVNGFGNRLLFFAVGRTRPLPHGAEVPEDLIADAGRDLAGLLYAARKRDRIEWTTDARKLWEDFYIRNIGDEDDAAGLVGALTARGAPQVARLALLFALLDPQATDIDTDHQRAAESVWDHNVAAVRWIFGDADGDPDADKLLAAIRAKRHHGMTSTEQSELFGRHRKATDLERLRDRLSRRGLIATGTVPTDGRPAVVSVAVERAR